MLATVQLAVFMFGFHLLSERNYIEKILENACYCSVCCIYFWFPSSIGKKLYRKNIGKCLLLFSLLYLCLVSIFYRKEIIRILFFFCGAAAQRELWPPHSWGFLDHAQRRTTIGRTALDEWSARRRDLYLTTHNTHNRQTSMPRVGFEPTISSGERPQIYALDRAATGTGNY